LLKKIKQPLKKGNMEMENRTMQGEKFQVTEETNLPASMVEIQEVVGIEGVTTLLNLCGGTRLFIPRKLKAQHKLANLLGFEAAQKMSNYFGGETLSIVRGSRAIKAQRNRKIIQRYDQGEKVPALAVHFSLTERQIYSILASTV